MVSEEGLDPWQVRFFLYFELDFYFFLFQVFSLLRRSSLHLLALLVALWLLLDSAVAGQDLVAMEVLREVVEKVDSSVLEALMANTGSPTLVISNFCQVLFVSRFYLIQASFWHQDTHAKYADQ